MTTYSIWPATDGPFSSFDDAVAINVGTEFFASTTTWCTHLRWFRGTTNVNADNLRLYQVDSSSAGTMLAEVASPSASGTGWQSSAITPVELTSGVRYKVVAHMPTHYVATGGYWTSGGPGELGITNGVLTAPDTTNADGGGQGTFKTGAVAFPDGSFNGGSYWVDVVLTDVDPADGSEVPGTGSAALGGLSATASGTRATFGTAAVVLGALAATAAGVPTTFGVAAAVLGGLTGAASGTRGVNGTSAAPLGGLSSSASGVRAVVAAASANLGGLAGTASGARTVLATANAALGVLAATIVGQVSLRGTGSAVLGGLTATASVDVESPLIVSTGNWMTLLDITREAQALAEAEASRPPEACPNDGEPLERGRNGILHCRFDGWTGY